MTRSLMALATSVLFLLPALSAQAGDINDVKKEMTQEQVRKIMGEPDDVGGYPTWKRFVPRMRSWSTDRKRMDWIYTGKGKVVFSHNQYTDMYKVVQVVPEGG